MSTDLTALARELLNLRDPRTKGCIFAGAVVAVCAEGAYKHAGLTVEHSQPFWGAVGLALSFGSVTLWRLIFGPSPFQRRMDEVRERVDLVEEMMDRAKLPSEARVRVWNTIFARQGELLLGAGDGAPPGGGGKSLEAVALEEIQAQTPPGANPA